MMVERGNKEEICEISEVHESNRSHSSTSIYQYDQTAPPSCHSVASYPPPDFSAFPAFSLLPFPALHTTPSRPTHLIPGLQSEI